MYLFRAMQISAKGCVDACIHTHSLALIYMARAIHEQKESLEEAVLRMGSEQIQVRDIHRNAICAYCLRLREHGVRSNRLYGLSSQKESLEEAVLRMGSEQIQMRDIHRNAICAYCLRLREHGVRSNRLYGLSSQKESLEEAVLRMGSEQIRIKKGKDKLCLKDRSV